MKKKIQKIRKNIMIKPELNFLIKETAGKYNDSESSVIEKALVKFLGEEQPKKLPDFFNYAGSFDCEHASLSKTYKNLAARRRK